jgi:glycine/D-amino acid oxidase-like deaminating enzyme
VPAISAEAPAPARVDCDVLLVGGGITGAATAWYAARAGLDVMLVDRGELGAAGSSANAGSLHAQIQNATYVQRGDEWARAYEPATRFMLQSIDIWRDLHETLGEDLEVALNGGILVAETEAQMRSIEHKVGLEHQQGLKSELLSKADLHAIAPYLSEEMVGGELCPHEGKANPLLATSAFARAAVGLGARVHPRTGVVSLTQERDGFTALTDTGTTIACRRLVSCGGIEAGAITAMLGAPLKVGGEAIQASVTETVQPLIKHLLYFAGGALTLKQARVGSVLIGGGWPAEMRNGVPSVSRKSLLANLEIAVRVVPAVAGARLLRTWSGFVNATDSWLPLIGPVPGVKGLFIGAFPYMGFTAGPLIGRTLSELLSGQQPDADIAAFLP